MRFGRTVRYGDNGPVGLLTDKRAYLLSARGGNGETSPDYQTPTMQAVFEYLGFRSFNPITLEGTRIPDGGLDERISKAHAAIDKLFLTA